MPGIIGYIGHLDAPGEHGLLEKMAHALEHDGDHRQWLFSQDGVGLGRISLGIANSDPQPVWNEAHTVCVVMEGELYDANQLRTHLAGRGYKINGNSDVDLVLSLYLESGDLFPAQLNGNFIIGIWDSRVRKVIIINDRLGLFPLYYGRHKSGYIFGSGVRALLADTTLPRKIDKTAIAQFLTFDHVLGYRTLLENVNLMPQGSIMTIDETSLVITPYSSLRYPKMYALRREEEYIEEMNHLTRQAVHRQAQDDLPKGVLLSGGLDSRVIAAVLSQEPGNWPLHTFTWGIPGCDDARYAQEVAAKTRAQHHFFPLPPDYLLQTAEKAVRITDGMGNLVNLHALANLDDEVKFARVMFKGFLGDAMFGFALRHQHWAEYDPQTAIQAHLQVHADQGVITFHPEEHKNLFSTDFQQAIGNSVLDEYRDGMLASESRLLADQRLYFDYTQRVPRMTLRGVDVVRSKALVRLPFTDNDLVEFSLRIPPGLRHDRRLVQHAFMKAHPELSHIPISWTGMPMQSNSRDLMMRARNMLQWHLYKYGLSKQRAIPWKPYKDYHNWFRGMLRPWMEGLLLSDRFMQRNYYQPESVRSMVSQHMAGKNQTVRLGAMLAIEIWHRLFID